MMISPSLVCLNYLEIVVDFTKFGGLDLSGIVRILLSCELAWLKFAVLVIFDFRLVSKLTCLFLFLLYIFVRFRFSQTPCGLFYCFVYHGSRAVSFLVLFGLIRFVGT